MQTRNGIPIVQITKKKNKRIPPDFSLQSITMIHKKKGSLRLPNFLPILKLMKESGWE